MHLFFGTSEKITAAVSIVQDAAPEYKAEAALPQINNFQTKLKRFLKNEKETRKGSEEVEFLLNLFAYMFDLSYKVVLGSRLISLSAFIIR